LLWHSQKGFESEDKPEQLNHIQKKKHHPITCTGGIRRIILYDAKKKRKGIWNFLKKESNFTWKEKTMLPFLCPREPE
jgi:hypothetical protein